MIERRTFLTGIAVVGAASLIGCSSDDKPPIPPKTTTTATATQAEPLDPTVVSTIASGLNVPWGIAFLASGDALVSQRDSGSIVRIGSGGEVTTLGVVAGADAATSEGGLMGIALDPDDESVLYAYVSTKSDDRLVRLVVDGDRIGRPEPLITGIRSATNHHGGRLLFDGSGHLFLAVGDGGSARDSTRSRHAERLHPSTRQGRAPGKWQSVRQRDLVVRAPQRRGFGVRRRRTSVGV